MLGYVIVGILLVAWGVSAAIWKFGHLEKRYGHSSSPHAHFHAHDMS